LLKIYSKDNSQINVHKLILWNIIHSWQWQKIS
jgi:hypothetical protein